MAHILSHAPEECFFVFDASTTLDEPGCIRIFMIKNPTTAYEHALSISEAMDLATALQGAVACHDDKYKRAE